ncbi:MAG: tripartite tricarboxylate transporter substrate binding protein [Xanthobacteraceae bacterium]|jgi:tripartite-type tricarboxylate transporter receptor subunit TctC
MISALLCLRSISRRATAGGIGILLLTVFNAPPAGAQSYPNQVIKIVVPFTAGGAVDVVARIVAPKLGAALGQPVIIENKGGAGGVLGATSVAQAAPDGYTLLVGTVSTQGTNSAVYTKLSYDPVRDFAPIVLLSKSPLVMEARPALPVKNVTEFIALAKREPGKITFGSYGVGSINHLVAELFNSMAGIQTRHVPYRGSAPMLQDLIGGQIDYAFDGVSTSAGYINAGTLRLLGIASAERTPVLPNAPTIAESGLPGFDNPVWFGLFAPAGTPAPIVQKLNNQMNAILAMSDVKQAFAKLGFEPGGGSPDALAQRVNGEIKKWTALVKEKNIHVEP